MLLHEKALLTFKSILLDVGSQAQTKLLDIQESRTYFSNTHISQYEQWVGGIPKDLLKGHCIIIILTIMIVMIIRIEFA